MKNLANLLYSIVLKFLCKHVMCINYRYESIMCDIFMMIREMERLGSWSSLLRHTISLLKSRLLLARVIRWPHLSLQRVHLRLFVSFHWIVLQAAPSWWWMIAEVWGYSAWNWEHNNKRRNPRTKFVLHYQLGDAYRTIHFHFVIKKLCFC